MRRSKLYRQQLEKIEGNGDRSLNEAISVLKSIPHTKFDETVELACKLGIDPKQSDQAVRGAISLPHGTGKKIVVIVIATGTAADEAKAAGADEVGFDELLEKIKGGWLDFDTMIATPSAMQKVRTLGKLLGPRGLMPNPKIGTVTDDTAKAVEAAKAGRVEYRSDKTACVHVMIGKISFDETALYENGAAVIQAIVRARPASTKGVFIASCTLSTTMSPGVKVSVRDFVAS